MAGQQVLSVMMFPQSKHPLYAAWRAMLGRCENPGDRQYPNYGARGISVCAEWHDFSAFATWIEVNIGPRPGWLITLDRIDNDDGYRPGNVRWADRRTQRLNQRSRSAMWTW